MDFLLLTFIRIVFSLLILRWPLLAIIISAYIDGEDWHLLGPLTPSETEFYQVWDKTLDSFYLGVALFTSLFWKDKKAFLISVFTYSLRTLGVVLFLVFRNSNLLFIFPNLFENFFIFYLIYKKILGQEQLFADKKSLFIVVFAVFIPKMLQEYIFHVVGLSPYSIISVSNYLGFGGVVGEWVDKIIGFLLYLLFPILALLWKLREIKALRLKAV